MLTMSQSRERDSISPESPFFCQSYLIELTTHFHCSCRQFFFVARFETPRTWDSCRSNEEKLNGAFRIIVKDNLKGHQQQQTCGKSRQGSNTKLAFD